MVVTSAQDPQFQNPSSNYHLAAVAWQGLFHLARKTEAPSRGRLGEVPAFARAAVRIRTDKQGACGHDETWLTGDATPETRGTQGATARVRRGQQAAKQSFVWRPGICNRLADDRGFDRLRVRLVFLAPLS